MRAGIVHNECESVRVSTVSIFGLASDTSWTPIITLSEVSFPSFSMTKCSTHVDPPFPTSLAPFRTFRHAHHVVESLPVHFRAARSPSKHHRSRLHPVLVIFWEDAVDPPASTVRGWSDHICANPMWCHPVQGLSCTYYSSFSQLCNWHSYWPPLAAIVEDFAFHSRTGVTTYGGIL